MSSRESYRNNPQVRQRAIDYAKEYESQADSLRRRRIHQSKRVYALRQYIEVHLEKVRLLEKRLFMAVAKLEKLKAEIKERKCKR